MTQKASSPQRFTFDTVFDGERVIAAPRPRKSYTLEELEAARAAAFAEGERSAVARAEEAAAGALAETARAAREGLGALGRLAHAHKEGAAELALAVAEKIAGAALKAFPEAPARAALLAFQDEFRGVARLLVNVPAEDGPRLERALAGVAAEIGFEGQIVVRRDGALKGAAFVFDWGDGRAAFDPQATLERVTAALQAALEAEAMNVDPLVARPPTEADR
jgi:flagellar assembly protein FliH